MSRVAEIDGFLAAAGWADAIRAPLAGDASARRYERLARRDATALLMDMPPESGLSAVPYLEVTAWLRAGGFSAPEILAADPGRGLVLIEDFGDDLFARLCDLDPAREPGLYGTAIDLIADLQRRPPPGRDGGWAPPPYDMAFLLREVRLVPEWYLPAVTGAAAPDDVAAEYEALAAAALAPVVGLPPVAVLRDYHAENLIWLPARTGHARVGLLDYQDMLAGHPAYDVVSLLEDARRDIPAALREAMLARYLERSGVDREAFVAAAHILSAQRNLKILGLFTRLWRRDGKPRYLTHLPRVWGHLQRDLGHPALAGLRDWTARHLPAPDAGVLARVREGAA